MSSQGISSVRAISGTSFVPMSGDPLSREVSILSASSIEYVPEVASRPVERGAIEPAQEAASTSGHQSKEEVEEIAVSCGDLQSSLTSEDYTLIAQEYRLEVVELDDMERPHTPLDGYVTLSEHYLQLGVRFPLHPFFVEVLEYFGLINIQKTPTGGPT